MTAQRLLLAAAAALVAAPAAIAPAQQRATNAQHDWSRTIAATPQGGFRMGNPNAPVKVIEYMSLTCPHCAAFAREGTPELIRDHVRRGRVSLEVRHFVLNGADMAASLLARCGGTPRYFPMVEQILAGQQQWMARLEALGPAQNGQLNALPVPQRLVRVAEVTGLTAIAARNGISATEARTCLTSEVELGRMTQMYEAASALGVNGTPTFLINGALVQPNVWSALEPMIRRAGS